MLPAQTRNLQVRAVGDIMLGNNHLHINRGVGATWNEKPLVKILKHLRSHLQGDICIGNLECALADIKSINPKRMIYLAASHRALELKELGFTHLCLANNHILDHGEVYLKATKRNLENAGLIPCGITNPSRTHHKGITVDVFNYQLVSSPNLLITHNLESIEKSDADYKIISVHWGDEYSNYPSPIQIELGHELIDRGANLVIGHHPHVLQGIERYRDGIIAYSLGNFIFDQNWSSATSLGCILQVSLNKNGSQRVKAIITQQNEGFVPFEQVDLTLDYFNERVHRFFSTPHYYEAYVRKRENWAKFTMKLELLKNIRKVSRYTWLFLLLKHFPVLEKILYETK